MSPRTVTSPPDDRRLWRLLLGRAHPDSGGTAELFVWASHIRDLVCGGELGTEIPRQERQDPFSRRRENSTSGTDRIPYGNFEDFEALTHRAVTLPVETPGVYGDLLKLLADCRPVSEGPLYEQQRRGASYKTLAAIGHAVGMSKAERVRWYRVAESVPLSQRHAGHILSRLRKAAA